MRNLLTLLSGGLAYFFRTYPSDYLGVGGIERYSSKPITNANGTVKCVVSKTVLTKPFLLREYISNGLELSAFIDQDFDPECTIGESSPPVVLVRVSSLTATTTNYFDSPEAKTSSAKKASPSNSLSPPTAPRTESSRLDNRLTTVHASPPPQKTADAPSIIPTSAPTEPIQLGKIGSVLPASTLIATEIRDTETPTGTGILAAAAQDQPQESSNSNPASRPGEPTPMVPVSQVSRTRPSSQVFGIPETVALSPFPSQVSSNGNAASRPGEPTPTVPVSQVSRTKPSSQVFGIPETVALSPFSSLPIGSSSILNPSDSFPIGDQTFSRPNDKPVTTFKSKRLPNTPDNPRPTSLPSVLLTFASQKFTVVNPSEFSPSGTAELHRGGSTITISGTQFISLGNSATILLHDDSSTTQFPVYSAGSLSQVPGSQVSAKSTSALPPALTAAGNQSDLFVGAQMKMAEVPMFIVLGATFFGIAAPLGLRYV